MLADTHSIHSGQKNYLCQLLNVPWVILLVTVPQHSYQTLPHYMQIISFKIFLSEWKLGLTYLCGKVCHYYILILYYLICNVQKYLCLCVKNYRTYQPGIAVPHCSLDSLLLLCMGQVYQHLLLGHLHYYQMHFVT